MKAITWLLLLKLSNVIMKDNSFDELHSWKNSWIQSFSKKNICPNSLSEYIQPFENYENYTEIESITMYDAIKCKRFE